MTFRQGMIYGLFFVNMTGFLQLICAKYNYADASLYLPSFFFSLCRFSGESAESAKYLPELREKLRKTPKPNQDTLVNIIFVLKAEV